MASATYVGPYDAVEVPELEQFGLPVLVSSGEKVTVPDEFGARLALQEANWKVTGLPKADPVAVDVPAVAVTQEVAA